MDDGFDWLKRVRPAVYAQLDRLMDFVAEGDHVGVDGIVPGIVAQARQDKDAWVEVFARNFELRSLILHRGDTRRGMAKAIALLDRAHQPDAVDCPQSICTAHAVCAAYGFRDGPGYVADRLAVSAETLGRTDPRRVCWVCISNEHAEALIDGGRAEEALTFIDAQTKARISAGGSIDPDDFGLRQTGALLALNRAEDALARLEATACDYRGASWQRSWHQWKARVLAELGRFEEAAENLSSPQDIIDDGGFRLHFETLPLLFGQGALPDTRIVLEMATLGKAALERGIARAGCDALLWVATAELAVGERRLVHCWLDHAAAALPELCDPAPYEARITSLRADLSAAPPVEPTTEPRNFEQAHVTYDAEPVLGLVMPLAQTWLSFEEPMAARALLEDALARWPDAEGPFQLLCDVLQQAGDGDALLARLACPPTTADGPVIALHRRALWSKLQGDTEDYLNTLRQVHAQRPEWTAITEALGQALWDADAFAEAGDVWASATGGEGPNRFDWLCIQAGTAADDWRRVRTHLRAVGYDIEVSEQPICGSFGLIRVELPDAGQVRAELISPAIARVLSLRAPDQPQWHGAEILIDPWPSNVEARREDPEIPPEHQGLRVLRPADVDCVAIDGADPGEAAKDALWTALLAAGFYAQNSAGPEYQVVDPASEASMQGMYWLVAVSPAQRVALAEIFEAVEGPGVRVWPELLHLLERTDAAEAHHALAKAWGMV